MIKAFNILILIFAVFIIQMCKGNTVEIVIAHNGAVFGNIYSSAKKTDDKIEYTGGAMLLASEIKKLRKETKTNNGLFLFLNSGSLLHGSNEAELTQGKSIVEIYNILGLDALTPGNREFSFGEDVFNKRLKEANFKIISSNFKLAKSGKNPPLVKNFIIKKINNIKIGIIGLTNPDLVKRVNPNHLQNFKILNYIAIAKKTISKVKAKGAEFIVILSHLLPDKDKVLAKKVNGIDLIIGRAIEPRKEKGKKLTYLNKIPYLLVDPKGKELGIFKWEIDKDTKKIATQDWQVRELTSNLTEPDPQILKYLQKYSARYDKLMDKKIGASKIHFPIDWQDIRRERLLGNLITDIIKESSKADFVFINTGGVRSLRNGVIKLRDILNAIPYENNITTVTLSGENILKILERGLENEKRGGWQFSKNMKLIFDSKKEKGSRIINLLINNKPINPKKFYRIGTSDYVYSLYDEFKKGKNSKFISSTLRRLFKKYLKKKSPISAKLEGRIVDKAQKK